MKVSPKVYLAMSIWSFVLSLIACMVAVAGIIVILAGGTIPVLVLIGGLSYQIVVLVLVVVVLSMDSTEDTAAEADHA